MWNPDFSLPLNMTEARIPGHVAGSREWRDAVPVLISYVSEIHAFLVFTRKCFTQQLCKPFFLQNGYADLFNNFFF